MTMTASTEKGELSRRAVPESFQVAMNRIIDEIAASISVESLRNLAIHPLGNPTLQLLIDLDMSRSRKHRSKSKESLVGKLMLEPEEEEERDADARIHLDPARAVHERIGVQREVNARHDEEQEPVACCPHC